MSDETHVYVLFGTTGEYSDRSEWVVCAYASREDADADCAALKAKAEGLDKMGWSDRSEAVAERLTPHDANAHSDYTGVDYTVEAVAVFTHRRITV